MYQVRQEFWTCKEYHHFVRPPRGFEVSIFVTVFAQNVYWRCYTSVCMLQRLQLHTHTYIQPRHKNRRSWNRELLWKLVARQGKKTKKTFLVVRCCCVLLLLEGDAVQGAKSPRAHQACQKYMMSSFLNRPISVGLVGDFSYNRTSTIPSRVLLVVFACLNWGLVCIQQLQPNQ